MMQIRTRHSKYQKHVSLLMAVAGLYLQPIFSTVLLSHLIMVGFLYFYFRNGMQRIRTAGSVILFWIISHSLLNYSINDFAERGLVDLAKYVVLILFCLGALGCQSLIKSTIYLFSIIFPIVLLIYTIVSDNPFVYDGRLAYAIVDGNSEKVVSPNTIGFIINFCLATLITLQTRWKVMGIPVLLYLQYLTFSRGAIIGLMVIVILSAFKGRRNLLGFMVLLVGITGSQYLDEEYLSQKIRFYEDTGSGRTFIFEHLVQKQISDPATLLLGFGPGSIRIPVEGGKVIDSAHNALLDFTYSFGVIGGLAFLTMIGLGFYRYKSLGFDSVLYMTLLVSYGLTEDLMGSQVLFVIGLMVSRILSDYYARRQISVDAQGGYLSGVQKLC
jgi:hypothetical protein